MSTPTAPLLKGTKSEVEQQYFQGKIGDQDFKADFMTHTLKNNFWLAEGTMRIPPNETSRQVVTFKYSADRNLLPNGRYTLTANDKDPRFAVIFMTVNDMPTPAYEAERGTIEFFHDINDNSISGALDIYFHDLNGIEVRVQILFSI